jgi:opacity protein-like surface antigen
MKKLFFILILTGLIQSNGFSQDLNRSQVSFGAGYAQPLYAEYFKDYWRGGININANYTHPVIDDLLHLQLNLQYSSFRFDEVKWRKRLDTYLTEIGEDPMGQDVVASGGMKNIIIGMINAVVPLPLGIEHLHPFVNAGLGLINLSGDDLIVGGGRIKFNQEIGLAYGAGVGIKYYIDDQFSLHFEGQYTHSTAKDGNDANLPISLKGQYKQDELGFLYLRFGLSYSLGVN